MHLNPNNCYHIKFSGKRNILQYDYYINTHKLAELDTIRDLGILYYLKLTFSPHINNVIKNSSKLLGFVIRNCSNISRTSQK